jgi:hypothetical protein
MQAVKPEPRMGYKLINWAENQPEYETLPSNSNGTEIETKWKLTWKERWQLFRSGHLYLTVMNFGQPLQPVRLSAYREPDEVPEVETVPLGQDFRARMERFGFVFRDRMKRP